MKSYVNNLGRLVLAAALLVAALAGTAPADAATVTGVIVNGGNGEPVRGAALAFEGTDATAQSDLNGLVLIELAPGDYTVTVSKDGFAAKKIRGVEVADDGGNFAVVLEPAGGSTTGQAVAEEITVTAEAAIATSEALLAERKGAAQISDSIGTEEMSKSGGSDAAGVLKRVPGISLQDGKFAFVRGLGDRYSNTALNGSKLPSTEFERKAVPLDLFPAGMIEKITVSKSYTVDKPGDFAAGFVELSTVKFPPRQLASISLGISSNSATTGDPLLEYPDFGLDFFGSGGQPLPASVPSNPLVRRSPLNPDRGFSPEQLETIGESIGGAWTPQSAGSAPFNGDFKASYGNSFNRLGFVLSASYENDFQTRDEEQNIFSVRPDGSVRANNSFNFDYTDEKVRQALNGNLSYRFADNHQIQVRSLYTLLSATEARFQEGFLSDIDALIEDHRLSYKEQEILNLQIAGDHYFNHLGGGGLLEWKANRSEATTDENRREALYQETDPGVFELTDNAQSGFLFFNDLQDEIDDFSADWTSFFTTDKIYGSVKAGGAHTRNDRVFDGRRLRFFHRNTVGIDLTLPPEQLFVPEFLNPRQFEIQEITRVTDTYTGDHQITAGYVQADLAWGKWRVVGGVRVESSDQQVTTFDRTNPSFQPIVTVVEDTDVLPSVSLVRKIGEATNLRFSASQTVNRPEFRELAPFSYTHVAGGFTAVGNPDLVRALITSYDVRWEWFPSADEVIAASLFYKDFEDPIENVINGGSLVTESLVNAEGAKNFGFELELRRNLGLFSEALDDWTAILNYTFVDSEVSIDAGNSVITNPNRALVGQPDNVANAILEWNRPESNSVVRLLYNFTDDKIASAGGFGLPDVLLEARGTLDVVWGQGLDKWAPGLSFKLSGSNLFNEEWLWTQGDGVFRRYEPGREVSFSISYKPFDR